jgi:predicted DNA-binding transcriptional regulator AlpA
MQQIIKLSEVQSFTGLSRSTIYRCAAKGTFPSPIKIGERSSGWIKLEVQEWLEDRIKASRENVEADHGE